MEIKSVTNKTNGISIGVREPQKGDPGRPLFRLVVGNGGGEKILANFRGEEEAEQFMYYLRKFAEV